MNFYNGGLDVVEKTFAEDLFKPIFSAVLVALFMAISEDTFTKKQRQLVFGILVFAGVSYLVNKRRRESAA